MRYLLGLMSALAICAAGCGESTCARGCIDGLDVRFVPEIASSYDVELVLDADQGAFTCLGSDASGWQGPTEQRGVGQLVTECYGSGFRIQAAPEAVEISVRAQDASWSGSTEESPEYTRSPRCPGESELCPPFATITVKESAADGSVE